MKKEKRRKAKNLKFIVILATLLTTVITIFLWGVNRFFSLRLPIDYNAFGTFGDFYGGFLGTILLIISVVLVYRTYREQMKQQVENRFFQLLKIHDSNVQNLRGKDLDIFNVCLSQIRVFVRLINSYVADTKINWELLDIVKLAYLYYFFGIVEFDEKRMKGIETIDHTEISDLNKYLRARGVSLVNPGYLYLGLYFRQIYQTVTYIDGKDELSAEDKYELVKTLRVRLNIEEQYLLFINSLTLLGQEWKEKAKDSSKNLITHYNLIKNIPKEFSGIEGIQFWNDKYGYPEVEYEFNKKVSSK